MMVRVTHDSWSKSVGGFEKRKAAAASRKKSTTEHQRAGQSSWMMMMMVKLIVMVRILGVGAFNCVAIGPIVIVRAPF